MSTNMIDITQLDLDDNLALLILGKLEILVKSRKPGHCLQVTDLPVGLMDNICQRLRISCPECETYILSLKPVHSWHITSTKLVERRNANEAVIVVFLPPDLRTSAEDSFDISTFERFPISDLYKLLRKELLAKLAVNMREQVEEIVRSSSCTDDIAICRFLLTLQINNSSLDVIGLAIYHLGLVPDPAVLDNLSILRPRLARNAKAVQTLSSPDSVLFTKIQSLGLKEGSTSQALYHFFNTRSTFNPSQWLPDIQRGEGDTSGLTFDKWEFRDEIIGDVKDIVFTSLGTVNRNEDGYLLFDVQGDKNLKISWETTPPPLQCQGLSHFTVEIMKDDVPVTEARTIKVGTSSSKGRTTKLKDLHKLDLEDGLYYIRVSALATGGMLLFSKDSEETLYFRGGLEADEIDLETTNPMKQNNITTLYEAMLRTQVNLRERDKTLADLKKIEVAWITPERRAGGRYTDQFNIKFNSSNQYILPINTILRRIEEETLIDADSLGRWELDLRQPLTSEIEPTLQPVAGIDYDALEEFLLCRKELFQQILNQSINSNIHFLVETSNLSQWTDKITKYAHAYSQVIELLSSKLVAETDTYERQKILNLNRQITSIDSLRLDLPNDQFAYLMGPTHPLKMLWVLQYARITRRWLDDIELLDASQLNWNIFANFLPRLISLNVPNTLVDTKGTFLVNVDNFTPFWSIFVPIESRDVRALVGRVKAVLGSPEADDRFTTITGTDLANKVQRYLAQHPYITTLCLNVVQPGSGAILVEMLLELEDRFPSLHYQIHIFSNDLRREELGMALDELMSPSERLRGQEGLDAFLTASRNALFPKLIYSKHALSELLDHPNNFESHITLLFDAFQVKVGVSKPASHHRSNSLYGLLYEYVEQFSSDGGNVTWTRQILPQPSIDLDEHIHVHNLMVHLYQHYNRVTAAIVSNAECTECVPTIYLPLGLEGKNLISQVHQVSDWVFTVDRNFGLEYLDSPYDEHCPVYLIDYQPEFLNETGHRLIISTQGVGETERLLQPVLERLSLPMDPVASRSLVNALRSVSGRLVLKLLSSPQMAHGAIGMALSRLFLEQAGLLQDMILIPLDAHPELFSLARQEAERLGQELSLRRTDMLLVELDLQRAKLTFHLIEVKFRQEGNLRAVYDLKLEIDSQLENSFRALRRLFDMHYTVPDRFDRIIRTKELGAMLDFYLERSVRYHLVNPKQKEPMLRLISQLEQGYTLEFTRSGIVISLGTQGYQTEEEGEITYHYLGIDRVTALIEVACKAEAIKQTSPLDPNYTTTRSTFTRNVAGPQLESIELPSGSLSKSKSKKNAPPKTISSSASPSSIDSPNSFTELTSSSTLRCDVILGAKHPTPQYGILGQAANETVGLDLNGTNTISLFGVQGSGKSYTLGAILEMAVTAIPNINQLPRPLAAVVFHYSKTEDYRPEFVSIVEPNPGLEADSLREHYGAAPVGLKDVIILTPKGKLAQRQAEFHPIPTYPITFDTSELDIEDWKFLMGVVGNDAMYVKKMTQILRRYRTSLTLANIYQGVASAKLSEAQIDLARSRLEFAAEYIEDGQFLRDYIRPGRLIVVDLRDELIEKDEALGLFMVMQKIFANARFHDQIFNKLIVFDEAHKYMDTTFIDEVSSVVREMRHKGTTVLIASQDPPSVPLAIIELSSLIILHQFSSPTWLKHIQKGATALKELTAGRLNMLNKGQAYIWSREATNHEFEIRAVQVNIRPRVTKHGGNTVTAI